MMGEKLDYMRQLLYNGPQPYSVFINKFRALKTDEHRLSLALELVVEHSADLFDLRYKQKTSEHSIKSREVGNKSFKNAQYYKAMQNYTESIVHAVDSSEELALAYVNRSAALFKLGKYTDCLDDIDRALDIQYPDKLKAKLYKRKGLCLKSLGRSDALPSFEQALLWLDKMDLKIDELNEIKSELHGHISSQGEVVEPQKIVGKRSLPRFRSSNPEIPCASDAVALKHSMKFGRHLVATRRIKPGEILVIEKPYCMVLFPKDLYTHCSHCLDVSWALIPCKFCINAAYCSKNCENKAWNEYHEVECPVFGFIDNFDKHNLLKMSVRTTVKAIHNATTLKELKQVLIGVDENKDPRTKGFSHDGKFHGHQYSSIYSLSNIAGKTSTEEMMYRTFLVAFSVYILARESKLFGKKLALNSLANNPDVIFKGGLILKNAHTFCINMHMFGTANTTGHGSAIMALGSLVNHSCNPNVLLQWYAGGQFLVATVPIEKGEQIFESYGPRFHVMEKRQRQALLRTGWTFECGCIACKENWPLSTKIPSFEDQQLCQETKIEGDKVIQEFEKSMGVLICNSTAENLLNMLDMLSKSIDILHTLTQKPCKELEWAIDGLRKFYMSANDLYYYEPTSLCSIHKTFLSHYATIMHKYTQL